MEDYLKADPTELLESPQTGFKLPEVMTVEEIDLLIGSIDRSTKEGQRNRAILETLYSCGLRVSELCNLKLSELYFEEASSKWKEKVANSGWFLFHRAPSRKSGSTSPTVT